MRKFPSKKLWHAWKFLPLVGEGLFWAMNPSPLLILTIWPFYLRAPVLLRPEETLRQGLQESFGVSGRDTRRPPIVSAAHMLLSGPQLLPL